MTKLALITGGAAASVALAMMDKMHHVDLPGVKYQDRELTDKMGFKHRVIERVLPPITARNEDLLGTGKGGKRAKRRAKGKNRR